MSANAVTTKKNQPSDAKSGADTRAKRDLTSQFSYKTCEEALRARDNLQGEIFHELERILAAN